MSSDSVCYNLRLGCNRRWRWKDTEWAEAASGLSLLCRVPNALTNKMHGPQRAADGRLGSPEPPTLDEWDGWLWGSVVAQQYSPSEA